MNTIYVTSTSDYKGNHEFYVKLAQDYARSLEDIHKNEVWHDENGEHRGWLDYFADYIGVDYVVDADGHVKGSIQMSGGNPNVFVSTIENAVLVHNNNVSVQCSFDSAIGDEINRSVMQELFCQAS